MTFHRPLDISEATRLTRAGRLAEATALLQHQLRGTAPAQKAAATTRTIDVDPRTGVPHDDCR